MSITDYYGTMTDDVNAKQNAGFNTSFTDYWGRSLSYQLFNASTGSPGKLLAAVNEAASNAHFPP
jgi:lysophospholipase